MTAHSELSQAERVAPAVAPRARYLRILVPIGRVLFAAIFVLSAASHFSEQVIAFAAAAGVPLPGLTVPLAGFMALIGGLSVMFGFHARFGAALIALFLLPVTLMMHPFWSIADPLAAQLEMAMFMKNMALFGAALLLVYFGAGPLSVDARRRSPPRSAPAEAAA